MIRSRGLLTRSNEKGDSVRTLGSPYYLNQDGKQLFQICLLTMAEKRDPFLLSETVASARFLLPIEFLLPLLKLQ